MCKKITPSSMFIQIQAIYGIKVLLNSFPPLTHPAFIWNSRPCKRKGLTNTFSARLYPKKTKKSLKQIENPKTACQVVSDSKLNVKHDARIHFAQKPREIRLFRSFCRFQGPKRVNSSLALNGLKQK